jgi:hypothetical protein
MKKESTNFGKGVGLWYGYGPTFLLEGKRAFTAREYGFSAERLKTDPGRDYFGESLVLVGISCDVSPEEAIRSLRKVIRMIRARSEAWWPA